MTQRTFSVCIPVRNGGRYLADAISSAVTQTRPADEILVLDDASTDDSAEIAQRPSWRRAVRYVHNDTPTGWADAFNRAAALATCDFVVILSADDLLAPRCLDLLEQGLNAHPGISHCFAGNWYADASGTITGSSPEPHSIEGIRLTGAAYARRYMESVATGRPIHRFLGIATERRLWVERCPIRREAGLIGDNDFFLRISALTDVVSISQPLSTVRHHGESVTSRLDSLTLRLAEDYVFETRAFMRDSGLDPRTVCIVQQLAARFVSELLFEAVRRGRAAWVKRARQLHDELERLVPGIVTAESTSAQRALWRLADLDRLHLTEHALHLATTGRKWLKSALKR